MTIKPLTKEDLLRGCDIAEAATATPRFGRTYDQRRWMCGTSCCIHGFTVLDAGLKRDLWSPYANDYTDVPIARAALFFESATPGLVRRLATDLAEVDSVSEVADALRGTDDFATGVAALIATTHEFDLDDPDLFRDELLRASLPLPECALVLFRALMCPKYEIANLLSTSVEEVREWLPGEE